MVEVRWGVEPVIRVRRLSPCWYRIADLLWWYPIARWSFWCRALPHIWVNYGCPTCTTFCARRCGATKPTDVRSAK